MLVLCAKVVVYHHLHVHCVVLLFLLLLLVLLILDLLTFLLHLAFNCSNHLRPFVYLFDGPIVLTHFAQHCSLVQVGGDDIVLLVVDLVLQ